MKRDGLACLWPLLGHVLLGCVFLCSAIPATPAEKASWQFEWEKSVAQAKSEGQVTVYGAPGPQYQSVYRDFQKAFPEIKVVSVEGWSTALLPRILAERRAGKYLADVWISGTTTPIITLEPKGISVPLGQALILPEVKDGSKWWGGKLAFIDRKETHTLLFQGNVSTGSAIGYNTKLVKPEEVRSYEDLLKPKWRGKIASLDPRVPSPATGGIRFLYYSSEIGPKFLFRFYSELAPVLSTQSRQTVDWLAKGKFALCLFCANDVDDAKKQGLPVDEFEDEHLGINKLNITAGFGSISTIDRAPHPNASKVFLNWLLSREGQTSWQRNVDSNSLRIDLPKGYITDWQKKVPQPGREYIMTDHHRYLDMEGIKKLVNEALARGGQK